MQNSKYYIIAIGCFVVFAATMTWTFIAGQPQDLTVATVMALLSGACWALLPTSLIPPPKVTFVRNGLKRKFAMLGMLPVYRILLVAGAILFSFGTVGLIISYICSLF